MLDRVKQCSTFHKGLQKPRKNVLALFCFDSFGSFCICGWFFAVAREPDAISQATGIFGDVNISVLEYKNLYYVVGAHIGHSFIVIIASPVIILRHSSVRFYGWSNAVIHA